MVKGGGLSFRENKVTKAIWQKPDAKNHTKAALIKKRKNYNIQCLDKSEAAKSSGKVFIPIVLLLVSGITYVWKSFVETDLPTDKLMPTNKQKPLSDISINLTASERVGVSVTFTGHFSSSDCVKSRQRMSSHQIASVSDSPASLSCITQQ